MKRQIANKLILQKNICLASPGLCSIGQYGHFNLLPLNILFRASLDIIWPQTNFMGGLLSVVCWRRMGQANMEWYQHFLPRSTSIGNSSFWFQTPVHCLCSITALMLISAGSATQPAEKLRAKEEASVPTPGMLTLQQVQDSYSSKKKTTQLFSPSCSQSSALFPIITKT